ncbi:SPFH domain-containing protein [Nonomuraea mangrovi]|uniref:SPFH domain-containing protein n=1 Tax=Nonomuraea mangrovi TaxID=2316207 RepID=A0ABW4SKH1_9ACTN
MASIAAGLPATALSQEPAVWAVTAGLMLAAFAVMVLRGVPAGRLLVVFRFGRVVAVKDAGLAVVIPGVHRVVPVPAGSAYLDLLWLEAVTRDGVAVTVNCAALASVRDPVAYALSQDPPNSALITIAETEIRRYVGEHDLLDLSELSGDERRELSAAISDRTGAWGAEITLIDFSRVEIRLRKDLARWAEGFAARARQASRQGGWTP